mmetsp:Transcript_76839/g.152378  ORF Transcript_76839/g.152378 Transcript_76839/m.152378 type:complete len:102 (+) Transcript_76839:1365-1670(+)
MEVGKHHRWIEYLLDIGVLSPCCSYDLLVDLQIGISPLNGKAVASHGSEDDVTRRAQNRVSKPKRLSTRSDRREHHTMLGAETSRRVQERHTVPFDGQQDR